MATLEDLPPGRFVGREASFYDAGQWTASTYFATVILPPYHRTLLGAARHYLSRGEYRFAVILAQTACEFLTERVIGHLLEARQVKYLEEWIQGRLRPYHDGIEALRQPCKILS